MFSLWLWELLVQFLGRRRADRVKIVVSFPRGVPVGVIGTFPANQKVTLIAVFTKNGQPAQPPALPTWAFSGLAGSAEAVSADGLSVVVNAGTAGTLTSVVTSGTLTDSEDVVFTPPPLPVADTVTITVTPITDPPATSADAVKIVANS